jgi:hypothetical protein
MKQHPLRRNLLQKQLQKQKKVPLHPLRGHASRALLQRKLQRLKTRPKPTMKRPAHAVVGGSALLAEGPGIWPGALHLQRRAYTLHQSFIRRRSERSHAV